MANLNAQPASDIQVRNLVPGMVLPAGPPTGASCIAGEGRCRTRLSTHVPGVAFPDDAPDLADVHPGATTPLHQTLAYEDVDRVLRDSTAHAVLGHDGGLRGQLVTRRKRTLDDARA